jgi:cytochrome c
MVISSIDQTFFEIPSFITIHLFKCPILRFLICFSCHGDKAAKAALNKSQIIAGWDAAKIVASVNGYKDGSYGGAMKGVMKPIASGLSDEDLKAVAATIASYK